MLLQNKLRFGYLVGQSFSQFRLGRSVSRMVAYLALQPNQGEGNERTASVVRTQCIPARLLLGIGPAVPSSERG